MMLCRTKLRFSDRCNKCVIFYRNAQIEEFLDLVLQRNVMPAGDMGRVFDNSTLLINNTWRANADAAESFSFCVYHDFFNRLLNLKNDGLRPLFSERGELCLHNDFPGRSY